MLALDMCHDFPQTIYTEPNSRCDIIHGCTDLCITRHHRTPSPLPPPPVCLYQMDHHYCLPLYPGPPLDLYCCHTTRQSKSSN